eukprot:Nk52_evm16s210 gene=Nk52_evmTU16s210
MAKTSGVHSSAGLPYRIVRWLFSWTVSIFFSTVEVTGIHHIPKEGPVIFVGNHANQFVDAMMLMSTCERDVSFLIAAKSMKRLVVGFFARLMRSISVARAMDNKRPGIGKVTYKGDKVSGCDGSTQFEIDFAVGDQFGVGGQLVKVVSIESNTEMTVQPALEDKEGMDTPSAFSVVPKLDQTKVYDEVWGTLHSGNAIAIFPEGGSHDRTELLPLKAGVTMMCLGAMTKYKGLDVKIVPCGLNYLKAHKFRSTAFVEYGKPITIPAELVERYQTDKRGACGELLDKVQDAMLSVVTQAPDYQTLQLIRTVRRLYIPDDVHLTPAQYLHITRRFTTAHKLFGHEEDLTNLREKVRQYHETVKTYGIKDRQVARMNISTGHAMELFFSRLVYLIILVILALPGFLVHLPIVAITKHLAIKKQIQAKKESTVKIAGRDVLASWKILIAFAIIPAVYATYVIAIYLFLFFTYHDMSFWYRITLPFWLSITLSILGWSSMRFLETGTKLASSLRPLFWAMLPIGKANRQECQRLRDELRHDVVEMVEKYGPRLYPNFSKDNFYKQNNLATKEFLKQEMIEAKTLVKEKRKRASLGGEEASHLEKEIEALNQNIQSAEALSSSLEKSATEQELLVKRQMADIEKLKAQLEASEQKNKMLEEELVRVKSSPEMGKKTN